MEGHIVFRDRHQPLLQHIVDVVARDVERDIFATLLDPRGGGVRARGLATDFRLTTAAIDQQLINDQVAFDGVKRLAGDIEGSARRIAQVADTGRCFDRYARIPQALGLHALFLGRRTIGDGLPDLRVGVERGLDRIAQFCGLNRHGAKQHCSRND